MPTLPKAYRKLIEQNKYQVDSAQENAILTLEELRLKLSLKKSFWSFVKKEKIKGVYLHGGVGRGKSMIMDLFFTRVPVRVKKRRVHFHEFMIETHDWMHQNRGDGVDDLLIKYANHVRKSARVLCFDEFHVTDVADAMILKRLFTALIEQDIIVIATSNWAPKNLYEGGLQRDLFMPFINVLNDNLHIVQLDGGRDYRSLKDPLADPYQDVYYFYPRDDKTKEKIDQLFAELSNNAEVSVQKISVKGRDINIMAAGDIARFTFYDLCERALGAEDYIKIAKQFDTVFIENIPTLTSDKRNEAKRFILLVDCLYEARCRLVLSAEKNIHKLYDGSDHAFEFDRTISRLMEMQSTAYHEKRLLGKGEGA